MSIATYQRDNQFILARAAEMLGETALPVTLSWYLERTLQKQLCYESRQGLRGEPPLMLVDDSKRGHEIYVGLQRYRLATDRGTIRLVKVTLPDNVPYGDFWAVGASAYRGLYRFLRRHRRRGMVEPAPVMEREVRERLWSNTIGLLRDKPAALRKYGASVKRGVLLLGSPGNGKTMACRWLASECRRLGLAWRSVTAEEYEEARARRSVPELFYLDTPGIVLFDDFDAALRDRREAGESDRQSTFLTQLDGIDQQSDVVYMFASNMPLADVDPALRRPGRIDVVVNFPKPTAELRYRAIHETWHADMVAAVDVEQVVVDTTGCSFAELAEAKKLLVMRFAEVDR